MKEKDRFAFNRVAFVASGGAFKALSWHIGVTIALKEYGFAVIPGYKKKLSDNQYRPIDHVIGSSGGSIFGAVVANGFNETSVERLDKKPLINYFLPIRDNKNPHITDFTYYDVFSPNLPNLIILRNYVSNLIHFQKIVNKYKNNFGVEAFFREILKFQGVFNLDKLEVFLRKALPINDFQKIYNLNKVDLNIVATEVNNPRKAIFGRKKSTWIGGEEDEYYRDRYLDCAAISQAVAASCSISPIYSPQKINGIPYFDGEIKQSLSVHIAEDNNADLIFVSHTFKPYVYNQNMGNLSDIISMVIQELYTSMYQKIQAPKNHHSQKLRLYNLIKSKVFKDKYNLSDKKHEEMVQEICDTILFNPNRLYIFLSAPPDLFFMDHFNLLPYASREILNIAYHHTRKIMDSYNFKRRKKVFFESNLSHYSFFKN